MIGNIYQHKNRVKYEVLRADKTITSTNCRLVVELCVRLKVLGENGIWNWVGHLNDWDRSFKLVESADKPNPDVHKLHPIASAPKCGRYILLASPSGYINTPLRFNCGRWSSDKGCWVDHRFDRITDGGDPPTHWIEAPTI